MKKIGNKLIVGVLFGAGLTLWVLTAFYGQPYMIESLMFIGLTFIAFSVITIIDYLQSLYKSQNNISEAILDMLKPVDVDAMKALFTKDAKTGKVSSNLSKEEIDNLMADPFLSKILEPLMSSIKDKRLEDMTIPELKTELNNAIEKQDYDLAAKIRDEIKNRGE